MFGVQPARDELYGQGWSITDAAIELDIYRTHLNRAVLGTAHRVNSCGDSR